MRLGNPVGYCFFVVGVGEQLMAGYCNLDVVVVGGGRVLKDVVNIDSCVDALVGLLPFLSKEKTTHGRVTVPGEHS